MKANNIESYLLYSMACDHNSMIKGLLSYLGSVYPSYKNFFNTSNENNILWIIQSNGVTDLLL